MRSSPTSNPWGSTTSSSSMGASSRSFVVPPENDSSRIHVRFLSVLVSEPDKKGRRDVALNKVGRSAVQRFAVFTQLDDSALRDDPTAPRRAGERGRVVHRLKGRPAVQRPTTEGLTIRRAASKRIPRLQCVRWLQGVSVRPMRVRQRVGARPAGRLRCAGCRRPSRVVLEEDVRGGLSIARADQRWSSTASSRESPAMSVSHYERLEPDRAAYGEDEAPQLDFGHLRAKRC